MTTFNVWMEGYAATGNSAPARYLGTFDAPTFAEACRMATKDWEDQSLFEVKSGVPSYWGCRMFDNESDSRKMFG